MLTNTRRIIQRLKQEGWSLVRVKGSHHQFKHPTKLGRVTVAHPTKDLALKTAREIYKSAGWEIDLSLGGLRLLAPGRLHRDDEGSVPKTLAPRRIGA
jgi:predicted RNA binding protein YcfA (HicA-like mRNA interferase family)